ncbi:MAG: bifunctional UDP-N-acetylmuramoyl-tripeptide:D-alanyl-D-alanine ligase/alanine racemase [Flavobacteriales bacterium]
MMMDSSQVKFSLKAWQTIVGGELIFDATDHHFFYDVMYDTRQIRAGETVLFVALTSERNDGHYFISQAESKGVRNFLVSRNIKNLLSADANYLIVPDTLKAIQLIAAHHRRQMKAKVVGITGSNGKTIVKEWLKTVMGQKFRVMASPASFNSQLGVPLSILKIDEQDEYAFIEAGISKPDEMQKLEAIIKPDIGIFTNIGEAHSENFVDLQTKLEQKFSLFSESQTLICSGNQELVASQWLKLKFSHPNLRVLSWGSRSDNVLQIVRKYTIEKGYRIEFHYNNQLCEVEIPFKDEASLENAMHVVLFALNEGLEIEELQNGLSQLQSVAMRLELKHGKNNCLLINDSYSADMDSLKIALDFAYRQKGYKTLVLILSDFMDSGFGSVQDFKKLAELIKQYQIEQLYTVGEKIADLRDYCARHFSHHPTTDDLLEYLSLLNLSNSMILLKGARKFEFERIAARLQLKTHDTKLEINLSVMRDNLNVYRKLIKADVKTMAMVKAYAYGSGGFEIASLLEHHGVDYLAVAYVDEGIALREAGISLPIMVMGCESSQMEDIIKYHLEPEVFSFRLLNEMFDFLSVQKKAFQIPIHIKLDTGMHRLGFELGEIAMLKNFLIKHKDMFNIRSIFSHLTSSGNSAQDNVTRQQITMFTKMADEFTKESEEKPMRHILNTSGISRFPEGQFDMVRLGIGLYGVGDDTEQPHLQLVSRLSSRIIQLKKLKSGERVGYNGRGLLERDSLIATVAIGYADGLARNLGEGKYSLKVKGRSAAIIGSVCMDMCMIDVTDIEGVNEGDEVVIFETAEELKQMARICQTIPYEVLTGISCRVNRIYYQN